MSESHILRLLVTIVRDLEERLRGFDRLRSYSLQ